MLAELPYVVIVVGAVLVGLWLSNTLYDLKVPHYISRKIGHAAGGLGFLIMVFAFSSAMWPIILAFSFGLLLWLARIRRPGTFRGVGGSGRDPHVMAEVWFAWIAVPVFFIGWLWLNKPFIAVSCLLFMAWGDCVTGLVRAEVYHKPVKGLWGSLAMLIVCLAISWALIKPFWIGAAGSVIATITEWAFGDVGSIKWADDNWAIPIVSLTAVSGLTIIAGILNA
jgi:phytol kinase